jgi:hypothetical protein
VLTQIRKVNGEPATRVLCECAFVPLVDGVVEAD